MNAPMLRLFHLFRQSRCPGAFQRIASWLVVSGLSAAGLSGCDSQPSTPVVPTQQISTLKNIQTAEDEALLRKLCSQCHLATDPSLLSKEDWERTVMNMVTMPGYGKVIAPQRIDITAIIRWFQERAPEHLALTDRSQLDEHPPPLRRVALPSPRPEEAPFVSQLNFVPNAAGQPRLLTCDMRSGWICEITSLATDPHLRVLSKQVSNSCRVRVTNFRRAEAEPGLLVANLGSFPAIDHNLGSVVWLEPNATGWKTSLLADNLGRTADVQPFDCDGDGDLDIAVAEFGWRLTGHVLLLKNVTRPNRPHADLKFETQTLDNRHGAVQLEVVDLNGDGQLDVIALLAQEHEVLMAYLHQPDGSFRPQELFRAPHPVWGFSGFQCIDFDGDQDLDVLLTNGDMLDGPTIKPYHSISWLENLGELKFEPHVLAELPGAHRAEAIDLDGDGDLDIVACTMVPEGTEQQAIKQSSSTPPALVWLEQTAPMQFEFHVWKRGPGRYPTLTTGDFNGDGQADVAIGVGQWFQPRHAEPTADYVELWLSGTDLKTRRDQ